MDLECFVTLVRLGSVRLTFNITPILSNVSFTVSTNRHIYLVNHGNRNGSALFGLVGNSLRPSDNRVVAGDDVHITVLRRSIPRADNHVLSVIVNNDHHATSLLVSCGGRISVYTSNSVSTYRRVTGLRRSVSTMRN